MTDYTELDADDLRSVMNVRGVDFTPSCRKQDLIAALIRDDNKVNDFQPDNSRQTTTKLSSKKRPASAFPLSDELPPKQAKTEPDEQTDKPPRVHVQLDDRCTLSTYHVHVDTHSGVVFDASLNQTNVSGNTNKFYRIQLLANRNNATFKTWTRWGRVGERGQNAVLGDGSLADARAQFRKKFKDKSGLTWEQRRSNPKPGKYVFVERSYDLDDGSGTQQGEDSSKNKYTRKSQPICTLQPPVKSLMQLIFNEDYFEASMNSFNYDANKLPLGKLSKTTIERGYRALKDLSSVLNQALLHSDEELPPIDVIEHYSNLYYSLIPHSFGRNRPPIISTHSMVSREVELLESLSDLKESHNILKSGGVNDDVHPLDSRFNALGLQEMTPLPADSTEFKEILRYLVNTHGETHEFSYTLREIFRIERQGETKRFEQSEFAKIASDRRLLWHGSSVSNFGGILRQGLRIAPPEAPSNGYMFGKGIYLADMSSKSAGYCNSYLSDDEHSCCCARPSWASQCRRSRTLTMMRLRPRRRRECTQPGVEAQWARSSGRTRSVCTHLWLE